VSHHPALLLVGPTGSGKTPLGEMIQRRGLWGSDCLHFDFGANLRQLVQQDRPDELIGPEDLAFLQDVLDTGALLEDEHFPIARRILQSFLSRRGAGPQTLVVLNGLPRHKGQARAIGSLVDVQTVVHLACSSEAVLARIRTNPGGDRTGRDDDDFASVRRKLRVFDERTAPLIDYYRRCGARIETIHVTVEMTPQAAWEMLNG